VSVVRDRASRAGGVLLVGLLTLFAFFWRLGSATSTGDELVYRAAAAAYLRGDFTLNLEHPPLAKWVIALGHALGDVTLVADRAPAAVCGVLTGVVLFFVARRCAGFWAGLATAALWAVLPLAPGVVPFHLDRRATLEAPLLLCCAGAVLAAQRLLDAPARTSRWIVLGALVGAATAAKLTGAVVVVVVLAALWSLRRNPLRAATGLLTAFVASLLVFAATYLPFGAALPGALRYVVEFQLQHADDGAVQSVAGQLYRFPPWWSAWWFQSRYLGWAATAVLWALALVGTSRWTRPAVRPVVLALAGTTLAVTVSPLKLPQYHDVLVPPLLVLAVVGASVLVRALVGRVVVAAAGVVVLLVAVPHLVALARTGPDEWARAAAALSDRLAERPGVVVVWGDAPALQQLLPAGTVTTTSTAVDCAASAVLVDPTVADRMTGADIAAWAGCAPSAPESFGRLVLYRLG
jgi:4-amino-4-deoxy-L-arabinose transferase-like glycosyltransferase